MGKLSPYRLMTTLFLGLSLSLLYGVLGALCLYGQGGELGYQEFLAAYMLDFRTLFSFGLIVGAAIILYMTQVTIPRTIRAVFSTEELAETEYFELERKFSSRQRSVTFSGVFIVGGFVIFSQCHFPLPEFGENLMIVAACAEYACGVYIGRKLCYAGLMLHALLDIPVSRNLFEEHKLEAINDYVNILSTLTIIFVYVHVASYHEAPFAFDRSMGESAKALLLLPAIIATPVLLIFNFYPRIVMRKIYGESIDIATKELQENLRDESLSHFERRSYLISYEKMARDELRYRFRLALSDLPFGITILIMVLEPLLR